MCHHVHRNVIVLAALVGLGLVAAGRVAAQTMYTVTDLGTLGGAQSSALGVSDAAHVVGWSETGETVGPNPIVHAFLWEDGVLTDLGTPGGSESVARAVNSAGQVVGWAQTPGGVDRAFLWLPQAAFGLPAGMNELETPDAIPSRAYDINVPAR